MDKARDFVFNVRRRRSVNHTAHVIDIGWTSVRLSVRPSYAGILVLCRNGSSSLNLSSKCLHCL